MIANIAAGRIAPVEVIARMDYSVIHRLSWQVRLVPRTDIDKLEMAAAIRVAAPSGFIGQSLAAYVPNWELPI